MPLMVFAVQGAMTFRAVMAAGAERSPVQIRPPDQPEAALEAVSTNERS